MLNNIRCPDCGRSLQLPDEHIGREVQCPVCERQFQAEIEPPPSPVVRAEDIPPEPAPASDPPRRRRRRYNEPMAPLRSSRKPNKSGAGVVITIVIIVIGIGIRAAFRNRDRNNPDPLPFLPNVQLDGQRDEQRQRQIDAFQAQRVLNEKEIREEIEPLFDQLAAAYRSKNARRILQYYDLDRLFDELIALQIYPKHVENQRWRIVDTIRTGMHNIFPGEAAFTQWKSFEIRHVKRLKGNEAVVVVHHIKPSGVPMNIRWWLTKRPGHWKAYDMAYMVDGLRLTMSGVTCVGAGFADAHRLSMAVNHLFKATDAALRNQTDLAEIELRQIGARRLPKVLEASRQLTHGLVHFYRNQDKEAMQRFDKAAEYNPDIPCLDSYKGAALNGLRKWPDGAKLLKRYNELTGGDFFCHYHLGDSYSALRRFDDACAQYRKALDYHPKSADALHRLLRVVDPKKPFRDFAVRFAKIDRPQDEFERFASECRNSRNGAALEQLCLAMQKIDPDHQSAEFHLALAYLWNKKADVAVKRLPKILAKVKHAHTKQIWINDLCTAATGVKKELEIYRVLPNPKESFGKLAAKVYDSERLQHLIDAHRKNHADDWQISMYQGMVWSRSHNYTKAKAAFERGLAKRPKDADLNSFRRNRVLADYHTGNGLAAYKTIEPKSSVFSQLANLYFRDRNFDELTTLLDLHVKAFPEDISVARYQCRIKIKKGQFAEAAAMLRKPFAVKNALLTDFCLDMVDEGKALEAYRAAPDSSAAFRILADDLLRARHSTWLGEMLAEHRRKHPGDHNLDYYQGQLHLLKKEWAKACDAFEAAWKNKNDKSHTALAGRYTYALYKADRSLEAYEKIGPRDVAFQQLARLMATDKKADELEKLIDAHRPHAEKQADLFYYQCRAAIAAGRYGSVKSLLKKAYDAESRDFIRRGNIQTVARELTKAGQSMLAYRSSPDPKIAFQEIARQLTIAKNRGALKDLLGAHCNDHANDDWLLFYTGEFHLLGGDTKKAIASFEKAYGKANIGIQWRFRDGLIRAYVKAGKAIEAYRRYGQHGSQLGTIATACVSENDAKQLVELIAAHRKENPDGPQSKVLQLDLKWLNKEYKEALQYIRDHETTFAGSLWRWKKEKYLVYCLVKTKQFATAIEEAEVIERTGGNRVLLVLAHAAAGNVKATIETIDRFSEDVFIVGDCYRDPVLGPILRSKEFAAFRKQFPEPK